jgi:hypothetical protein
LATTSPWQVELLTSGYAPFVPPGKTLLTRSG